MGYSMRLCIIIKKSKRICRLGNFPLPASHRVKIKDNEKRDKYLDFASELKRCGTFKKCFPLDST